jgi:hypothetical protein
LLAKYREHIMVTELRPPRSAPPCEDAIMLWEL